MDNDAALKAHEREEEARENDDAALEHQAIIDALHSIPDVITAGVCSPARRIELLIRDRQQHIDMLKDTQARIDQLREGIRCALSPGSPNVFEDASDAGLVSEVAKVVEERDTVILRSANADKYPASLEAAILTAAATGKDWCVGCVFLRDGQRACAEDGLHPDKIAPGVSAPPGCPARTTENQG